LAVCRILVSSFNHCILLVDLGCGYQKYNIWKYLFTVNEVSFIRQTGWKYFSTPTVPTTESNLNVQAAHFLESLWEMKDAVY